MSHPWPTTRKLSLESSRWSELDDAYGPADDVPALLRQLPEASVHGDPDDQPWFDLWSRLSHQGTVYAASYASFPWIVAAASERDASDRAEYLSLAGSIECRRHAPGAPEMPDDLVEAYQSARTDALTLTLEALVAEARPEWIHVLLGVVAGLKGQHPLAEAIDALEDVTACPVCGAEFPTAGFEEWQES